MSLQSCRRRLFLQLLLVYWLVVAVDKHLESRREKCCTTVSALEGLAQVGGQDMPLARCLIKWYYDHVNYNYCCCNKTIPLLYLSSSGTWCCCCL